ncbi:hypothetical protein RRG08_005308 [Elysia crispata]|uniref:Uncharacterized protein n=1 Tax=Elysia crispata TaxID=231223 RepID=A0AAE0YZK1_9GAST|nr:hypothetical protein RRG08_005308 [Elysia crispata]
MATGSPSYTTGDKNDEARRGEPRQHLDVETIMLMSIYSVYSETPRGLPRPSTPDTDTTREAFVASPHTDSLPPLL